MDMHKRVRLLEGYAVVSLLIFGVLAFSGFTPTAPKFDEITVQRLNLVEKNGQLVLVMANRDRMPDPIVNGKTFKSERPPGIIFYNGLGDENGGLVLGAANRGDGKYGANAQLTFDQYKQAQTIGLMYSDHQGDREAALRVWDRPEVPLTELWQRREAIDRMPDGPEKETAKKDLREATLAPTRVFVGKSKEREAKVTLYDAKGRARINMLVDASGTPRLDFLDDNGKVTYSLPGNVSAMTRRNESR
jgi:hypothetical protein